MIADQLDRYIRRSLDLPWAWGVQDCTIWVADWCMIRWGMDPAARFRGTYGTEAEAEALTGTGLVDLVAPEIPLPRKDVPEIGDIGVIEIAGRRVAAIWTGTHWTFRTPRGVSMSRRGAIAIWGN
ncbi:DUF6950 family protein [Paracoccus saliphilus]|uniref:DUF6950 family protein n=1 Tax=Paracoccus saliphilus TaxID=405559 RepID=UPI002350E5A0|nr:hypothetical protein [Paracoccus saliphilus]